MKNKLLYLLTAIAVAFGSLPLGVFADSVVFVDADKNTAVNEIATSENVHTEVSFTASETGKVSVITSGYDASGKMVLSPVVETIDAVAGDVITHTTAPVSTSGVDKLKVFVWNFDSLSPVLKRNSVLNKVFSEEGLNEKFSALHGAEETNPYLVAKGSTIAIGEIFEAVSGAEINNKHFTVKAEAMDESSANATFIQNLSDWKEGTVAFSGEGMLKLTVQDYDFCNPATMYVKVVAPVDRYGKVFENTDTYLYRVGNKNTVALSSLFEEKEEAKNAEPPRVNTQVTVEGDNAGGTYNPNDSDWTKGTIQFSGTGVVTVSIKDDNSKTETLKLEVIDAKNITKAEGATANDVVLLNDISGTFTVSNGHTFHGNGFTVTVPAASTVQNKGDGFTGWVSIGNSQDGGTSTGGNIDNVRIIGPVYPEANIYRQQAEITSSSDPDYGDGYNMRYFRNTVIVYGGDVTISNSYISGSRAAICLRGSENVVLKNTTLSGGAYANMHISTANKVTFDNVTTVQTDVADSYGKGKTVHGLGIAIDSYDTDIYIKGELTQHNWLCQEQWNALVPSTYRGQFPKFFTDNTFSKYWHYLDGGTDPYVNLGLIFACDWNTSKIHDERTDAVKAVVPYDTCSATVANMAGGVYSKVNTSGDAITDTDLIEPQYVSPGFDPTVPILSFDNSPNYDAKDESNAADTYCVYTEKTRTLDVGITGDAKTLDLSKVKVLHYGNELDYELYLNGTKLSGNTATVDINNGTTQMLTVNAIVQTAGFDAEGNIIPGLQRYSFDIKINIAKLSFPAPEWDMDGVYQFETTNCYFVSYKQNITDPDFAEAVPIYEGIKVKYYNKSGELIELDLSDTTTKPSYASTAKGETLTYTLADESKLSLVYNEGWLGKVTSFALTNYNGKIYIYPNNIDTSGRDKVEAQNFDVKFSYTFTDPHGKSTGTQVMNWYNAMASNKNVKTVQWQTFDSSNGKPDNNDVCVTGDTLVTLADGTQKRVDELTYNDKILAWDFYEGSFTAQPVSLIINHGEDEYEIITVKFDDGTELDIVGCHGVFNKTLNEFVDIDACNVETFVGDIFMKTVDGGFKEVKMTSYEIKTEYDSSFTLLSSKHFNAVLNDMLTISPSAYAENLYEPFEVGGDMKYDEEKMKKDIETYGLYTYDEFSQYLTKEQFDKWGIANMKITVGKGYTTYETIIMMLKAFAIPNA